MRRPIRRGPRGRAAIEAAASVPTWTGSKPAGDSPATMRWLRAPGWMPKGRRVYVIGDIHGCKEKLVALRQAIAQDLTERPVPAAVLAKPGAAAGSSWAAASPGRNRARPTQNSSRCSGFMDFRGSGRMRRAPVSVGDFRRKGAATGSRSAAVHPYGEHRRPGPGGRSRKAPMLSPGARGWWPAPAARWRTAARRWPAACPGCRPSAGTRPSAAAKAAR